MADMAEGMLQWKQSVEASTTSEVYSDEWWDEMTKALVFVPEEQRPAIMAAIVGIGVAF